MQAGVQESARQGLGGRGSARSNAAWTAPSRATNCMRPACPAPSLPFPALPPICRASLPPNLSVGPLHSGAPLPPPPPACLPPSHLSVGPLHSDAAVEASRTQQRSVQDVGAVGGGDADDRGGAVAVEAVQFCRQSTWGGAMGRVEKAHQEGWWRRCSCAAASGRAGAVRVYTGVDALRHGTAFTQHPQHSRTTAVTAQLLQPQRGTHPSTAGSTSARARRCPRCAGGCRVLQEEHGGEPSAGCGDAPHAQASTQALPCPAAKGTSTPKPTGSTGVPAARASPTCPHILQLHQFVNFTTRSSHFTHLLPPHRFRQ